MIRALTLSIALLVAAFAAVPVHTSAAAPPPPASNQVTTTVVWPYGIGNNGSITATFVATPNDEGTWTLSATFKPKGVSVNWNFFGDFHMSLKGTATGQAIAEPGQFTQMSAFGCYWSFSKNSQTPAVINCAFTIDAGGVVNVSSISVI